MYNGVEKKGKKSMKLSHGELRAFGGKSKGNGKNQNALAKN